MSLFELDAFRALQKSTNCSLLLDTYDVHEGIKERHYRGKEMEESAASASAVRIDSETLHAFLRARKAFDGRPSYIKILIKMILTSTPSVSLCSGSTY